MIHILTHEYPPQRGGAGVYCREIALAACKNSMKVSVWAPTGSTKDDEIEMLELPWAGSQNFISSWKLVRKSKNLLQQKKIIGLSFTWLSLEALELSFASVG